MRQLFFLLFVFSPFLFSYLQSQEETSKDDSMVINSGEAQYDGKEITLIGEVVVQHSLGQISARRLTALPAMEQEKKNKFGLLKISDQVQILLKEGGELHCQMAEIDYAKMKGIFLGDSTAPDVTYSIPRREKVGEQKSRSPLEIKSTSMTLSLIKEPATELSSSKTLVKQIEADQQVRVHYNDDYLLLADHGLYQRFSDAQSPISGLLTLTVRDQLPHCKMTNLNGDHLSAHQIQLDTNTRQIKLSQPVGVLYLRRESYPLQTLEFSSQDLVWDDPQQNLLLLGQVNVNQNKVLQVNTDHRLSISQAIVNGKKTLRYLHSPQHTHIVYSDVQKGNTHKIYSPGPFTINHETQEMSFQGALSSHNIQNSTSQVHIDDILGEMFADQVNINYRWEEQRLFPNKMILEGHVKLLNRFDGHLEESGSILHYALADRVEYFPKEQEMILSGLEKNRVLFFDKVNNVQMSAPSLKVKYDPATKKETIQGLGDVRFTFIEKEFDQMKQYFPLGGAQELKDAKSRKE